MQQIFILLVLFQIKHFLADYPLQNQYMLGKFKDGYDWILPLLSHVGVHFLFTLMICLIFKPELYWLAFVDFILHFCMDRIKASKKLLGRFKMEDKKFWWSLGFDQGFHHLTHYFLIYILVR